MANRRKNEEMTKGVVFRMAWCSAENSAHPVEFLPPGPEPDDLFYITSNGPFLAGLLSGTRLGNAKIVDISSLKRIIFPEKPEEEGMPDLMANAHELESAWNECVQRLDILPVWALEFLAGLALALEESGAAALFGHWAETLGEEECDRRWQSSFPAETRRQMQRPLPTLADCSPLDPDEVAQRLGPDGALAKIVPGYEPRPGQLKMLKAVVRAFNEGKHLMVEAGTGIGKSLAYLLPAALWARLNDVPVVVSTNTKNLQAQLVEKDLPAVLAVLDGEADYGPGRIQAAVIKGRSNYLCLRRFGQMLDGGAFELMRPELRMLACTVVWAAMTRDGDFDSITGSGAVDPQFLHMLASSPDECLGRGCSHYARCFVQKARDRALKSNLVIANHSLVFAELGSDAPVSLPPHSQIIFDEAHNLEDAATSHFTHELSAAATSAASRKLVQLRGRQKRGILHSLLKRVTGGGVAVADRDGMIGKIGDAITSTTKFQSSATALLKALAAVPGENAQTMRYSFPRAADGTRAPHSNPVWQKVSGAEDSMLSAAAKLESALKALAEELDAGSDTGELNLALGDINDIKAAIKSIGDFTDEASFILDGSNEDYVYWVESPRRGQETASAFAAPVNVGRFLAESLYSKLSSVVICSATLSVAGSFKFMASRLGMDQMGQGRIATCIAPSPFDYERQCSLLVPDFMPSPLAQDRSYVTDLSALVYKLARRYSGRTMVLFTSYEMMRQCADLLRERLEAAGLLLLVQGESGSRSRMTRVFRQDSGSVLFGTQSFWEGVDVMGEALSCVIVAKLPFASPSDPVISARCEKIDEADGHSFFELSVPLAVLKLKQGFGRLIRHRNDRGSVVIADTRVFTKNYGRTFLNSLPATAKRCASMEELEASLV